MCYSALLEVDLKKLMKMFDAALDEEAYARIQRLAESEPKKFRFAAEDHRIFPNYWAPVVHERSGKRLITPMRYSAFAPRHVPPEAAKKLTTFNARRDNLSSQFWSEAYGQHHGILVIHGFYEWVAVGDLLRAGVVTLEQVRAKFAAEMTERRQRVEAQGKKFKPTPTELKDPAFRDIVIMFAPQGHDAMLLPAIISASHEEPGLEGFAVVTDGPAPEVRAAGHDRTPIQLTAEAAREWLAAPRSGVAWDALLDHRQRLTYQHRLPEAA